MKKVLLFISMLLAAVLITGLYSCTQDGGENDSRHQRGNDGKTEEEIIVEKACESLKQVSDIYMECHSIADLKERAGEISRIENVENVYFTDISMYVKVKDFITVAYRFHPKQELPQIDESVFQEIREMSTRASKEGTFSPLGLENAVIVDQQTDRPWGRYKDAIEGFLEGVNIDTEIVNSPDITFYEKDLYKYDIVLLISHGDYDPEAKLHWLDLDCEKSFDSSEVTEMDIWDKIRHWYFHDGLLYKDYILNKDITIWVSQREEDGHNVQIASFAISERFISSQDNKFRKPGKAIVYSCACRSLMGGEFPEGDAFEDQNERNFDFAKAFVKRGAGVYIGFDEINGAGQRGGMLFLGGIASGQSVINAYKSLPNSILHDERNNSNPGRHWTADCLYYPENFDIQNYCQVFLNKPTKDESETEFIFKATEPYNVRYFDYYYVTEDSWIPQVYDWKKYNFKYGFEYSTTSDFDPAKTKELFSLKIDDNTVIENHTVKFTKEVPKSDLEPETTYYYRAYLNDGFDVYYSDYDTFTTPKQERIEQVIPKEILETMEPYITIYEGDSPPVVEGVYVISPNVISYDSTNGFDAGELFADHYLKFSNQDILKNTLDFEGKEVVDGRTISYEGGPGAFISGTGDNFTVFFDVSGTAYFDEYNVDYTEALVISGTLTSTGIKNAEYSFVLTWKGDDPKPYAIKKGDFRVFKDNDGLASKATWPSGARRWGWDYKVKDGKITTPWSIYAVKK